MCSAPKTKPGHVSSDSSQIPNLNQKLVVDLSSDGLCLTILAQDTLEENRPFDQTSFRYHNSQ